MSGTKRTGRFLGAFIWGNTLIVVENKLCRTLATRHTGLEALLGQGGDRHVLVGACACTWRATLIKQEALVLCTANSCKKTDGDEEFMHSVLSIYIHCMSTLIHSSPAEYTSA